VQLGIKENRGNLSTVDQILQIAICGVELSDLAVEFGVDGFQLFVERLQFLLGGFKFLVGGLILFVRGLQFLVRRFELFKCGSCMLLGRERLPPDEGTSATESECLRGPC
jgi:hypothetical protein